MQAAIRGSAFPDGFMWGAATASYQIEGGVHQDGRGVSIWDTFCRTPGKVFNGDTGDVACDHYNRWQSDLDLMAELGLKAYRFSIAWPRILPTGTGAVNQAGLDFYSRLVDGLLSRGITPFATLYHWDLPQPLQDAGGWPDRMIIEAFANYTDVISRKLGDRVKNWMTINEPWVVAFLGYGIGVHAPGVQSIPAYLSAAHNLLLAHGRAVQAVRANVGVGARVGIVLNLSHIDAATDSEADKAAARREDGHLNRWFLDPVYKGSYPADMVELFGNAVPNAQPGDFELMSTPIDFLGINNYSRNLVAHSDDGLFKTRAVHTDNEYTEMDWEVYPKGLYQLLMRVHRDYNPGSIYVTENGAAFADAIAADGKVHDERRVAFLRGYLTSAQQAIQEGAPLHGYFVWSLMDNFEWALGYSKRFGVVYVDYPTQRRIPKDSALFYADVIRRNAVPVA